MIGKQESTGITNRSDGHRTLAVTGSGRVIAILLATFLVTLVLALFRSDHSSDGTWDRHLLNDVDSTAEIDEPDELLTGARLEERLLQLLRQTDRLYLTNVDKAIENCERILKLSGEQHPTIRAVAMIDRAFLASLSEGRADSASFRDIAALELPPATSAELRLHYYTTLMAVECRTAIPLAAGEADCKEIFAERCRRSAQACESAAVLEAYYIQMVILHLEHLYTDPGSVELQDLRARIMDECTRTSSRNLLAALTILNAHRMSDYDAASEVFIKAAEIAAEEKNLRLEAIARKWAAIVKPMDRRFFVSQIEACLGCAKDLGSTPLMLETNLHLIGYALNRQEWDDAVKYIKTVEDHSTAACSMSHRNSRFLRYAVSAYGHIGNAEEKVAHYTSLSNRAGAGRNRAGEALSQNESTAVAEILMQAGSLPSDEETRAEVQQSRVKSYSAYLVAVVMLFLAIGLIALGLIVLRHRRDDPDPVIAADDRFKRELDRQVAAYDRTERLGVMAGGIAHDMNNLMTGVMCNAELLQMSAAGSNNKVDEQRSEQIIESVEIAAELSRKMLAFAGRQQLSCKTVCMNRFIDGILPQLTAITGNAEIIKTDFANDLEPVDIDLAHMEQVIANLVINSLEASDEWSAGIIIRTGRETVSSEFSLGVETAAEDYVFIEVEDFGKGIEADNIDRIFDPFFSTSKSQKGLGLSLVFGVVKAHKGFCNVESDVGKGTTVRLLVPSSKRQIEREADRKVNGDSGTGEGRVLVVDDQEVVRTSTRYLLEVGGWEVIEAADGNEAIDILEQRPGEVDCMIIDVMMPRMNGDDLLDELSRKGIFVPTVVMSGFSHEDLNAFMEYEQVVAVMQKPFPRQLLWLNMRKALSTH